MFKISKTIFLIILISFIPRFFLLGAILTKNNGNTAGLMCADADRYYNEAIFLSGKTERYLGINECGKPRLSWDLPIYFLFLSVFFKVFTPSLLLCSLLNILLFVICAYLLYRIGDILFGERAALSAVVIFSFYPSLLIFTLLPLVEPLFTLFILSGTYFFILYLRRTLLGFLVLSSIFMGLAGLTKESSIFIPLVIIILVFFKHIKQPKKALRDILLIMAVYIITLAPLSLYNHSKFGTYMLSGKMRGYFTLLSNKKALPRWVKFIKTPKESYSFERKNLDLKNYLIKRRHFFGGTGTLSMLRAFGYDIDNKVTYLAMKETSGPLNFLEFIRKKSGINWAIYQALAWVFIACVYITSLLALFVLFLNKKFADSALIILMIAYFLYAYNYRFNSRYFYIIVPFLSLLSGYFGSIIGQNRKTVNEQ